MIQEECLDLGNATTVFLKLKMSRLWSFFLLLQVLFFKEVWEIWTTVEELVMQMNAGRKCQADFYWFSKSCFTIRQHLGHSRTSVFMFITVQVLHLVFPGEKERKKERDNHRFFSVYFFFFIIKKNKIIQKIM